MGVQKYPGISDFLKVAKTFIVRMGDKMGLSNAFIFKYVNKQDALIPNMVSKVVYGFFIKSYEQINFQKSAILRPRTYGENG